QHARLDWAGHAWVIRDLNSRNGTYVNGARVTSQPVRPGDQIVVGQTVLVFQAGTAPR
ncbi:MAG: FHA domain-containing protein, partial [Chloroflexi bacterium]|nr:FHA domain-containing protein [Chloroflexota bacterium]MBU1746323.1 FHA domain-containing protein [Chloroflexota bacterium]